MLVEKKMNTAFLSSTPLHPLSLLFLSDLAVTSLLEEFSLLGIRYQSTQVPLRAAQIKAHPGQGTLVPGPLISSATKQRAISGSTRA